MRSHAFSCVVHYSYENSDLCSSDMRLLAMLEPRLPGLP